MTTDSQRILLIDDDHELGELIMEYLSAQGIRVESAPNGELGIERALSGDHVLVVLDVMLPGIDGFEVLRRIRAQSRIPVLMLTARGEDVDRIIGLELGADDYLPKPFNPRELSARVRAILRRATNGTSSDHWFSPDQLVVGDVEMDVPGRQVHCGGQSVQLTSVEFDLLEVLLRSVGKVVDRKRLFQNVLDREPLPMDRSIDMHVSHLRQKLGKKQGGVERIVAVRGVGYVYTNANNTAEGAN